eukprot:2187294-Pyramimonas_sp.AAC.1
MGPPTDIGCYYVVHDIAKGPRPTICVCQESSRRVTSRRIVRVEENAWRDECQRHVLRLQGDTQSFLPAKHPATRRRSSRRDPWNQPTPPFRSA